MNQFTTQDATQAKPDVRAIMANTPVAKAGAHWFYWIAGLSLVNTILIHSGSDISFIVGLGFTLVADSLLKAHLAISLFIDALALGCIAGLGYAASRGMGWAFITGIVLYFGDAVIYLIAQDWLSVAFHGYALFCIIRGYSAFRTAYKEALVAGVNAEKIDPVPVSQQVGQ